MSWQGSTGHIDANVPDYQKMLHTRYPSSGWSSTHTGFPGLSGRSQSSNYLNARNRHSYVDPVRLSGRPVSPPYQPSKYGLPSDLTYNTSTGDTGIYRSSNFDEDVFHRENGYERSSSYGYTAHEFDFGPYRTNAPRSPDYSSDTGGPYRSNVPHNVDYSSDSGRGHLSRGNIPHNVDYSSDSGRGHVSRSNAPAHTVDYSSDSGRGHVPRGNVPHTVDYSSDSGRGHVSRGNAQHTIDYSSDSGRGHVSRHMTEYASDSDMSYRRQRRKSSEFELDIPSPIMSRKEKIRNVNEDLFASPKKIPPSEFSRFTDNRSPVTAHRDFNRNENFTDYHVGHHDRASPDIPRNTSNHTRTSPHSKQDSEHISNHDHSVDSDTQIFSGEKSHDNNQQSSIEIDHSYPHDTDHVHDTDHEPEHLHSDDINSINSHDIDHIPSHDIDNDANPKNDRSHTDDDESRPDFMSPPLYRGRTVVNETKVTKKPPSHKASDLTQWQQRQRNQESRVEPDSQVSYRGNPHSYESHDHYRRRDLMSPRENRSQQLESIRSAADAIIRDKDAIIDDLRQQILGLEETVKEYENKLRRSLMSRSSDQGEPINFSKMKDMEYRNAQLRTQVANLKLQKEAEVEELEIKLGGVEHEVVQLRSALRKNQPHQMEFTEKLQQKDREIEEWKNKFTGLKESHSSLKEKLDSLERYISDLPAPEELSKNAEDLAVYKEENRLQKEQIEQLDERLTETTELLSDRELMVQELENKQQHLAGKMKELTKEIHHIKSEGEGKALQQAQEELQEALEVKERVTLDLEKAKKLLEINHRKIRQLEVKHQNEVRQVQERLGQEEESVIALREEGRLKEQQIAKLKKSLKEFAGKNQDLMDENLILKDQIKQHEAMSADENQKLQRRFVSEMSVCFSELQSLVQICVQRAEGEDPNISLLLGMRASSLDTEEEGAVGGGKKEEQTLKHWFKKLKELRAEVEKIRKMICNKYAEDMGDNLNCATQ